MVGKHFKCRPNDSMNVCASFCKLKQWMSNSLSFFKKFLTLIYFWEKERDRALMGGGTEEEKETQNLKQTPGSKMSAQSPTQGSNPQTMRSWPELKMDAQLIEPPRCPCPSLFLWGIWKGTSLKLSFQRRNFEHKFYNG